MHHSPPHSHPIHTPFTPSSQVEFNDSSLHRTMRLTDHYGFSMAALDDAAVVFASRANNGNPSTVVYRPLASWAPNSDWQVQRGGFDPSPILHVDTRPHSGI
jgi:hypothetical protein